MSWRRVLWGCLGCCVPAEIRLEGSDSGVRQVLLRGSRESVLSWHTWSPGCGVHPLGGVLRRGPPWPGLALAPGGEPVGAGARSWSSGRGVESNTGRWGVHALGRYCVRSRWGSVGRFASLPLLLGLPNALGCRRWGAGCRRRLSTLRLSSLRRPGEPGRPCGLILPELYSCINIFALS